MKIIPITELKAIGHVLGRIRTLDEIVDERILAGDRARRQAKRVIREAKAFLLALRTKAIERKEACRRG